MYNFNYILTCVHTLANYIWTFLRIFTNHVLLRSTLLKIEFICSKEIYNSFKFKDTIPLHNPGISIYLQ